jgi:hypothetical protein
MKRADAVAYVIICSDVTQNRRLMRKRGSRSAGSLNSSSFLSKYYGCLPHTDRQTDRQTDRLTDWLTHSHTGWWNGLSPWSTVILEYFKESFVNYGTQCHFSDAFGKLRKSDCFVMSVIPSIRLSAWNNSAPIVRIFVKFDIWIFIENLLRKPKFQ